MLRVSATSSAASTAPQPLAMAPTPTSPSPSPAVALLALALVRIQFSLCHRFRHDPPLKFAAFHFHLVAIVTPGAGSLFGADTEKCGSIEEGCSTATRGRSRWRREMSGVAGHLKDGSGEVWGAGFAS